MSHLLIYVQEDLIIPHVGPIQLTYRGNALTDLQHYTFYDFIVNKARGKSGPLFNFDVHDDVRLLADATKEKDESHAGKVVERSYYQRNKHIFPASRWEVSIFSAFVHCQLNRAFRSSIQRRATGNTPLHDIPLT